jgi:hypothetical protein
MPTIRISLDCRSFRRLAEVAIEHRRAIPLQAEVLVLQALGCWLASDQPGLEAASNEPAQCLLEPTR